MAPAAPDARRLKVAETVPHKRRQAMF